MRKMQFFGFFNENILGKLLGFDRMHEKKYFFGFLKEEINLIFFGFSKFFRNV
jgi:hypothetical protein